VQDHAQAEGPEEENDILQPGDVLRVNIWRQPEFSGDFAIGPDSVLVHPLYQDIRVGGLELTAARQRLADFLSTYLQDAHLVVQPLYPVTVAGEVGEPNLYHFTRGTTVAQAIAQAGGPTAEGRLDRVVLQRGDANVTGSLTAEFSQFGALPVGSGDQIFVQRRTTFNFFRDVMAPVTNLAVLALTIVRISNGK
jgi:polysaccharide export outer membrane protein